MPTATGPSGHGRTMENTMDLKKKTSIPKKGYAISERFCRSKDLVKMSKEDRHALLKEQMENQKYRKELERRVKIPKQKDENPERIVNEVTEGEERSMRLLDDRSPDSTDLRADFNRMSCRSSPAQSASRPASGTPQSRASSMSKSPTSARKLEKVQTRRPSSSQDPCHSKWTSTTTTPNTTRPSSPSWFRQTSRTSTPPRAGGHKALPTTTTPGSSNEENPKDCKRKGNKEQAEEVPQLRRRE